MVSYPVAIAGIRLGAQGIWAWSDSVDQSGNLDKIAGNRFRIAGGRPGIEVSWQVTGIRQYAFANANRAPVEEPKAPEERGLYLHPAVFGLGEDLALGRDMAEPTPENRSATPADAQVLGGEAAARGGTCCPQTPPRSLRG